MRLGDTRRVWRSRPFRIDRGVRRLRSRNDTEYLLSNPVMARRLREALEQSLAGCSHPFPLERLIAEVGPDEDD